LTKHMAVFLADGRVRTFEFPRYALAAELGCLIVRDTEGRLDKVVQMFGPGYWKYVEVVED